MDQTTPSYSGTGVEGSTFGGPDTDNFDYFPYGESYSEVDFYNVPNQVNQLSFAHHVNQPSINIPPRIFPESPPGSFPMRFVAQSGIQGSPSYSSSSGTPPSLSFQAHKPQHLLHAPYDISASAIKRLRGVSATYSDHSSSPNSLLSCKQEDELGFVRFPQNEGGAQFLPGQFYQESSALSVFDDGHRTIEFKPIFQDQCCVAVDSSGRPTIFTDFKVQADKGFNHSQVRSRNLVHSKTILLCHRKLLRALKIRPRFGFVEIQYLIWTLSVRNDSTSHRDCNNSCQYTVTGNRISTYNFTLWKLWNKNQNPQQEEKFDDEFVLYDLAPDVRRTHLSNDWLKVTDRIWFSTNRCDGFPIAILVLWVIVVKWDGYIFMISLMC